MFTLGEIFRTHRPRIVDDVETARAVPGYPWALIHRIELADGAALRLRPIRPDDEPRLVELFSRLSPRTVYQRFFRAYERLPEHWYHHFANVDYRTWLAVSSQQIVIADESADRWLAAKRPVSPVPIVVVEPAFERGGPLSRAVKRWAVRPLTEHGADEALGCAIRAGRVGPGAPMDEAVRAARCGKGTRPVAGAVVTEDAVHADAAAPEPRHGAAHEAADRGARLIGQDFGVRHARAVVDADMDEFPADAARLAATIAGDAMADVPDAPEFLDVDMQQLAGARPLVADDGRARGEGGQPGQAELDQGAGHSGGTHRDDLGDLGPGPAELPQPLDLDDHRGHEGARRVVRATRPILERPRRRALDPVPHGSVADAKGTRHRGTAEIAIVVEDGWQHRGLGSLLLDALLAAAAERRNLRVFTADVLADNRPMLRVLSRLADIRRRESNHGILTLEFQRRRMREARLA